MSSDIRFKPKVGNEANYVIIFKEHFDVVHKYLILDIDCSDILNPKRAKKIKSLVEKKDMRSVVYFNNYSFETFSLNHIRTFGQPIANKKDYDQHIKKHFGVSHWSTMKNTRNTNLIIDKITDETFDVMTKNIKQIYKKSCFENPNSNMHLLFAKIDKIK